MKCSLRIAPKPPSLTNRSYAPQGEVYVRALAEAFETPAPPRFELWFLWAGEARTVGVAAGAPGGHGATAQGDAEILRKP